MRRFLAVVLMMVMFSTTAMSQSVAFDGTANANQINESFGDYVIDGDLVVGSVVFTVTMNSTNEIYSCVVSEITTDSIFVNFIMITDYFSNTSDFIKRLDCGTHDVRNFTGSRSSFSSPYTYTKSYGFEFDSGNECFNIYIGYGDLWISFGLSFSTPTS
jgi:hypothetical protein